MQEVPSAGLPFVVTADSCRGAEEVGRAIFSALSHARSHGRVHLIVKGEGDLVTNVHSQLEFMEQIAPVFGQRIRVSFSLSTGYAEYTIQAESTEELRKRLSRSVDELELSVRSYNCLKKTSIETVGELLQRTEEDLMKTHNFGRKSMNEIKELLEQMGFSLGMDLRALGIDPAGVAEITT